MHSSAVSTPCERPSLEEDNKSTMTNFNAVERQIFEKKVYELESELEVSTIYALLGLNKVSSLANARIANKK